MQIVCNANAYADIRSLSFAPEADPTGQSLPINGFSATLALAEGAEIPTPGAWARLEGDDGRLWANYYVTEAAKLDARTLYLAAQSPLRLIDRDALPATMYDATPVEDVLVDIFRSTGAGVGARVYSLDGSFAGATITGFAPEQTARERLLWTCLVLGAWVKSSFSETVALLPATGTATLIPMAQTYWRPRLTARDAVTAIRAAAYSFAPGVPAPGDVWVKDGGGACYIVQKREITLTNPNAPAGAPDNVLSLEGVSFVNEANVAGVLSRAAAWAFQPGRAALVCVNNGDFAPGDRVRAYASEDDMFTGVIRRAVFEFGAQARSALTVAAAAALPSAALAIRYLYNGTQVGRGDYRFPVGMAYEVAHPWIDMTTDGARYVFRPLSARAEGIMPAEGVALDQPCEVALELRGGVLWVRAVDAVSEQNGTGVIT